MPRTGSPWYAWPSCSSTTSRPAEDVVQDAFAALARRGAGCAIRRRGRLPPGLGRERRPVDAPQDGVRSRAYKPPARSAAGRPGRSALVVAEEHREVLAAVKQLPDRQREVLVLRYWSGLSEAEIALPSASVRDREIDRQPRPRRARAEPLEGHGGLVMQRSRDPTHRGVLRPCRPGPARGPARRAAARRRWCRCGGVRTTLLAVAACVVLVLGARAPARSTTTPKADPAPKPDEPTLVLPSDVGRDWETADSRHAGPAGPGRRRGRREGRVPRREDQEFDGRIRLQTVVSSTGAEAYGIVALGSTDRHQRARADRRRRRR